MPDNRYSQIIERVFFGHYTTGSLEVTFDRQEIADVAEELGMARPKNLGDVIYSFRFRTELPERIANTATSGRQWVLRKIGQSQYRFVLVDEWSVVPNANLIKIKVPDSTPGMIERYAR